MNTPGGIRTPDLLIRSQLLYPAELRTHGGTKNRWILCADRPIPIPQAGFEPATLGLEVRCSVQLSYWGAPSQIYGIRVGCQHEIEPSYGR